MPVTQQCCAAGRASRRPPAARPSDPPPDSMPRGVEHVFDQRPRVQRDAGLRQRQLPHPARGGLVVRERYRSCRAGRPPTWTVRRGRTHTAGRGRWPRAGPARRRSRPCRPAGRGRTGTGSPGAPAVSEVRPTSGRAASRLVGATPGWDSALVMPQPAGVLRRCSSRPNSPSRSSTTGRRACRRRTAASRVVLLHGAAGGGDAELGDHPGAAGDQQRQQVPDQGDVAQVVGAPLQLVASAVVCRSGGVITPALAPAGAPAGPRREGVAEGGDRGQRGQVQRAQGHVGPGDGGADGGDGRLALGGVAHRQHHLAPAEASRVAMTRPMPSLAPVTTARRPVRSGRGTSWGVRATVCSSGPGAAHAARVGGGAPRPARPGIAGPRLGLDRRGGAREDRGVDIDRAGLADFLRRCGRRCSPRTSACPWSAAPHGGAAPRGGRRAGAHVAGLLLRLERERGPQPSESMLASIAQGLHLSLDQRDHLFRLAATGPRPAAREGMHVAPGMLRILDRLEDTPAEVVTELGETCGRPGSGRRCWVTPPAHRTGPQPGVPWFTDRRCAAATTPTTTRTCPGCGRRACAVWSPSGGRGRGPPRSPRTCSPAATSSAARGSCTRSACGRRSTSGSCTPRSGCSRCSARPCWTPSRATCCSVYPPSRQRDRREAAAAVRLAGRV